MLKCVKVIRDDFLENLECTYNILFQYVEKELRYSTGKKSVTTDLLVAELEKSGDELQFLFLRLINVQNDQVYLTV